jgi:DNA-binding SARP family transcriptional activator
VPARPREYRILGPLEVVEGDRAIDLGGGRPRALLALLLLNPNETLSTERLIDDLWGDTPPGSAAKTVQVTVSRLRKALGAAGDADGAVITRGRGYELRVDPERIDARRFERLLASGRAELAAGCPDDATRALEAALALWRGAPLSELADQPFARHELGRLEDLRLDAVEELVEARLALGRHAEVISQLEQLVAEHPYRERLHAQLILALYRAERQADALQAYQAARRRLVDDLGIEPGERLRELERAVLAQDQTLALPAREAARSDATAPDAAAPGAAAPRARSGAFVGRDRELDALADGLERALSGSGSAFLVAGEPGIGKSRLAEELAVRAAERGARVLVGRCWEAGGAPPYWPWVQALRAHLRESDADALAAQAGRDAALLATVLPELRDRVPGISEPPTLDSEGARFRLLESVASFVHTVAAERPLVLVLDDLHAADAPSLLLLRFVARELPASPILVIGCYRDTEVGPELAEALAELAREPVVERLALGGLSGGDTSRLLAATIGEGAAGELVDRVHAETQGNPLFATEIARLLESEGPEADPARPLPIPAGISEAIGRRLGRQSGDCRAVLAIASVAGREFEPAVLARVGGLDEDAVLAALEEAAGARLVGELPDPGGRMRFSHILVRDTLYHGLPAPERLRLHRAIAAALELRYAGDLGAHAAELAHHYLAGGSSVADRAIEFARRAGARAAAQLGFEEAARHYASALRVAEASDAVDPDVVCELLVALGEALSRAGSDSESKAALRRAARLAAGAGRPDLLARAALDYGGRFAWARGSADPDVVPLLERALEAVGAEDSDERVRVLGRLAGALRDEPLRDRREHLADEAVAMAERLGDPATIAFAIECHFVAVEGPDNTGRGLAVGEKLIGLGQAINDPERVFAGHDHRVHSFWQLGDGSGLRAELATIERLAGELRQPAQRWHAGTGRTMLALMEGRFADAERVIEETAAVGRRSLAWNAEVSRRLALFVLRREQGRLAEVEETMRRSADEYPALLRFRCALAHLHAELGSEADARATLDDLFSRDLAREHRDAEWVLSMTLLCDPVVAVGHEREAERLHSLLAPFPAHYAQAPVEAVFGAAARGLGVLATALGRFDDAVAHLEDAIEIEARMGARPWLAHARHHLAEALIARGRDGDSARAGELLAEATATYDELGMASWVERARALK